MQCRARYPHNNSSFMNKYEYALADSYLDKITNLSLHVTAKCKLRTTDIPTFHVLFRYDANVEFKHMYIQEHWYIFSQHIFKSLKIVWSGSETVFILNEMYMVMKNFTRYRLNKPNEITYSNFCDETMLFNIKTEDKNINWTHTNQICSEFCQLENSEITHTPPLQFIYNCETWRTIHLINMYMY